MAEKVTIYKHMWFLKLRSILLLTLWTSSLSVHRLHRPYRLPFILYVIVSIFGSYVSGEPFPGWKEETDWSSGNDKDGGRRGPHLLPDLPTNISVTAGMQATLPCRVANLKGRAVSWIRQEDLRVLATDEAIFTSDNRLKVVAWRTGVVWAWDLQIAEASVNDSGVYECQVNTRPKISHPVILNVQQGGAVIAGPSEIYVEIGSRLLLTCWVTAPPKPPGPLTWYHGKQPIHAHTARSGVSLHVAQEGPTASARLSLTSVAATDAGNYSCNPEGLTTTSVTVYVLQDKEPRAMHHDSATSNPRNIYTLTASFMFFWIMR
ncbi:zwei Ig domain protein zig-8-like [Palaemon carinicauda]|uniref:zwei Ig domain protein zig-8-like n=1 Tax=Palaemon carinicauda TaxID=392227 RepID=UPI0035B61C71